MLTCLDVANYFLAKHGNTTKDGDLISNLKLQKLVYYAQGFHLAFFGESLFEEAIEAWEHGPVVRPLYNTYKTHRNNALPIPSCFDDSLYPKQTANFLDCIYSNFGQFTAWKLREMTHQEEPWLISYNAGKNTKISIQLLTSFFLTQKDKIKTTEFNYSLDRMKERINDEFELVPNLATAKDIEQWLMQ
ncbi:Panacea domain-containing protein [Rodentibacter ratti]|uniref:Antitoxin SocA-like Panacea domain-containing protein n=1 Tax=Rodentibacter ratti TaxID=1906745 RepID=A0A1V3L835_9PAST|nr:type II toxin-antitoxin system antitoxin SocA domain-containing protein [Rodentibacter ratti]OOF85718.1 hypothetical protein BKG88_06980 [Rodentibacter ratti]